MEDETRANSLDLLARYRRLCEASGGAGASGMPLPRATREQLDRIEAELQTRLWLASAEPGTQAPRKPLPPPMDDKPSPALEPTSRAVAAAVPRKAAAATVFCDGACIGNPGPGGFGAIVQVAGSSERTVSGGKARTTNNEMEMTGAIEGIKLAVSLGAGEITVVSDSEYLVKGMTGWLRGWLRNGWKTRAGEPVKNRALWEELHNLCQGRSVTWSWTRGHAGHPENERCDRLAVAAAEKAAAGK